MSSSAEYTFGPPVGVDVNLPEELKPVHVNLAQLSSNLQTDFPWLDQNDWSRVMLHISEDFPDRLAGSAMVVGQYHRSRYLRFMKKIGEIFIPGHRAMPYKKIKRISKEEDVLVLVKAAPKLNGEGPYSKYYNDPSRVAAHELKHAAQDLEGTLSDSDLKSLKKASLKSWSILGGIGLGAMASTSGMFELGLRVAPLEAGIPSIVGGIALLTVALSRATNMEASTLDNPMLDINPDSESLAHAYAVGTNKKWEDVIQAGAQEAKIDIANDWTVEEPQSFPWFNH